MTTYVLTYDLNGDETSAAYTPLIKELLRWGSFKYQKSAWLVASNANADAVWKHFCQYIDINDHLWVSEFTTNWQASKKPGLAEWIASHSPSGI